MRAIREVALSLRDDAYRAALDGLRDVAMGVELCSSNSDEDQTGLALARVVRDIARFGLQPPGCGDCVQLFCQICKSQISLGARGFRFGLVSVL